MEKRCSPCPSPTKTRPFPLIIAHRGGAAEALENSMSAFKRAWSEIEVDMLELDVWRSGDGLIVVAHDRITSRVCGESSSVDIKTTKYENLPLLLSSEEMKPPTEHMPPGNTKFSQFYPAERFLLLEDLLSALPKHMQLHIDVKDHNDPRSEEDVVKLLRKYDCLNRTFVASFSADTVNRVKAIDKSVKTVAPVGTMIKLYFYYIFGLSRWTKCT